MRNEILNFNSVTKQYVQAVVSLRQNEVQKIKRITMVFTLNSLMRGYKLETDSSIASVKLQFHPYYTLNMISGMEFDHTDKTNTYKKF